MPLRLWFDLTTVLRRAETADVAPQRVNIDGNASADVPPALHLMRDYPDRIYIDGNAHPNWYGHDLASEPFHSTDGRHFGHGITWTGWLGAPPRHHHRIQARIPLTGDTRLLDLLRAGYTAGFDMFTIDADTGLRPSLARHRARRAPRAGAPSPARPRQGPTYTSSYRKYHQ